MTDDVFMKSISAFLNKLIDFIFPFTLAFITLRAFPICNHSLWAIARFSISGNHHMT